MRRVAFVAAMMAVAVSLAVYGAATDRWLVEDGRADGGVVKAWGWSLHDGGRDTTTAYMGGQPTARLYPPTCSSNACTRAAPALSDEGMAVGQLASYMCTFCVDGGTLSGTGSYEVWVYDPDSIDSATDWSELAGQAVTPESGNACVSTGVKANSLRAPGWRVLCRANAIGTSAAAPGSSSTMRGCIKGGCAP